VFIEKIDGSFSAVMGLPLFETVQLFKLAHLFETVDILRTTTLTKTSP
jgi:predicted house-cleaning NTP pyrophosphatase (Maf/HAM1 superfamily)